MLENRGLSKEKSRYVNQGRIPFPSESSEQISVIEWAALQEKAYPELRLIYKITNEGKRSPSYGARMKREGLRKGFPDMCLPVARGGYSALYVEMKAIDGKLDKHQKEWIDDLNGAGNCAVVCYGADEAIQTIIRYLKGWTNK